MWPSPCSSFSRIITFVILWGWEPSGSCKFYATWLKASLYLPVFPYLLRASFWAPYLLLKKKKVQVTWRQKSPAHRAVIWFLTQAKIPQEHECRSHRTSSVPTVDEKATSTLRKVSHLVSTCCHFFLSPEQWLCNPWVHLRKAGAGCVPTVGRHWWPCGLVWLPNHLALVVQRIHVASPNPIIGVPIGHHHGSEVNFQSVLSGENHLWLGSYGIIESLKLEKASKIILSNH